MEGPGPCGAQGDAMSCLHTTQLQNMHLICFAAHSGPVHSRPHPYRLVLYGCTPAAVRASKEEDASAQRALSMAGQAADLSWEHCWEELWGMNPGLRLPGEGLGLSWEWLGFIIAIRRDTSRSTSLCTGKISEMPLAPLMSFSYFFVCVLPCVGSGMGFSGEGKHVSTVGS